MTGEPAGTRDGDGQRIDRWLWFARFYKSRSLATKAVEDGRLRLTRAGDTQRIAKASQIIRPGDILTFSLAERVRVIAVAAIGVRRGPASEAQALYEDRSPPPPVRDEMASETQGDRPSKRERRAISDLKARYHFDGED